MFMAISGVTVKVFALLMLVRVSRMAGYAHSDVVVETPTLQTAAAAPSNTNPVVVAPTIPNPNVIVAEPPTVAVAATPISLEVVAATTRKRVGRVTRIPERFID